MKNNTSALLFLLYPKKLRKTMTNIIIKNKKYKWKI